MEILLLRDDMGEPWIPETETVNPPTVAVVIGLHGVGETAPGEEEQIDLSAGIAWFGDILNRGSLVEIGRVDLGGRPPRPPTDPDVWNKKLISSHLLDPPPKCL